MTQEIKDKLKAHKMELKIISSEMKALTDRMNRELKDFYTWVGELNTQLADGNL